MKLIFAWAALLIYLTYVVVSAWLAWAILSAMRGYYPPFRFVSFLLGPERGHRSFFWLLRHVDQNELTEMKRRLDEAVAAP